MRQRIAPLAQSSVTAGNTLIGWNLARRVDSRESWTEEQWMPTNCATEARPAAALAGMIAAPAFPTTINVVSTADMRHRVAR